MTETPASADKFNERLARFRHDDPLPSPRSTPSPYKRLRTPSPEWSRKRHKQESDDFHRSLTPTFRRSSPTPSAPSTPKTPKRKANGYAPPARYAHLSPIPDVLQPNLLVVFVGLNPGISTAKAGHAYSHPSNRFWHLLHISGLTPERKLSPSEDRDLPRLYRYGHTNIVSRPTPDQSGLSKAEMEAGTAILEAKFAKWKPEAVCIAGKGIWEAIWKYKHGKALKKDEFKWGWQDESENMGCSEGPEVDGRGKSWTGARVYITTSPSGQAASVPWADKVKIWTGIGDWVKGRRVQNAAEDLDVKGEVKSEQDG